MRIRTFSIASFPTELRPVERLPADSEHTGVYAYDEIPPLLVGRCELHIQAMTVTTLREREA